MIYNLARTIIAPIRKESGLAICRVGCRCGKMNLSRTKSGEAYCKACGTILPVIPESGIYRTFEELTEDLSSSPDSDVTDSLRDRISTLEKDVADRNAELTEAYELIDTYRDRIHVLESEIEECSRFRTDSEDLRKENWELRASMKSAVDSLRSEIDMFRRTNESLACENKALEETKTHLTSEMSKTNSFDLREIVTVFMEYSAIVNNLSREDDSLDHLRMMIAARTTQMVMKLKGQGITVNRHEPGESLGDGRVDVSETFVSDPESDMKVVRSNRFGCTFRDDLFAPVIENVTVNRFKKTEKEIE